MDVEKTAQSPIFKLTSWVSQAYRKIDSPESRCNPWMYWFKLYVGWVVFRNSKTIHSLRAVHPKAHLNAWHDMMTYQCIKEPSNSVRYCFKGFKVVQSYVRQNLHHYLESLNNSSQAPIWVSTNSEGVAKECVWLTLIIRGGQVAPKAGSKPCSAIELYMRLLFLQVLTDMKSNAINQYHHKMLTDNKWKFYITLLNNITTKETNSHPNPNLLQMYTGVMLTMQWDQTRLHGCEISFFIASPAITDW